MKKISVLLSAIVVAALCVTGVSAMEGNDVTAYGHLSFRQPNPRAAATMISAL